MVSGFSGRPRLAERRLRGENQDSTHRRREAFHTAVTKARPGRQARGRLRMTTSTSRLSAARDRIKRSTEDDHARLHHATYAVTNMMTVATSITTAHVHPSQRSSRD